MGELEVRRHRPGCGIICITRRNEVSLFWNNGTAVVWEHLAVAQPRLSVLLVREFIFLPQSEAADRTRQINGAERSSMETHGIWVSRERAGHRRRRHRGRCGRLFDRRLIPVGLTECSARPEGEHSQARATPRNLCITALYRAALDYKFLFPNRVWSAEPPPARRSPQSI